MKKKLIILIMALVLSIALISTKKADAYAYDIKESDFFNQTYEYNIVPKKLYYLDKTAATPITSLYIDELTIYYQVGYLRDDYNDYEMGSIFFSIEEVRLVYYVSYYSPTSPTNPNTKKQDSIVWRVPRLGNSNSDLEGTNIFYTELFYDEVFNGVDNFSNLTPYLDSILPSVRFSFYSSKLNDSTIQLHPNIFISLYTDYDEFEANITKKSTYIQSLPYDSSVIGTFKAFNFDIVCYYLPLIYWERLEEETAVRKYVEQNPPIDPNTSYDNIMTSVFGGFADILSIEVFPNITIGLIIGLPLLLGALLIILKFIRG
jgi:hypothetical protein